MTIQENPEYKVHRHYVGKEKYVSSRVEMPPMHKLFETKGAYNFGELDLIGERWKKIYPLQEEVPEVMPSKEDNFRRTLVYRSTESATNQAMATMHIDMKNDRHEIDIFLLQDYMQDNNKIINETKSMLERALKCKLSEREIK